MKFVLIVFILCCCARNIGVVRIIENQNVLVPLNDENIYSKIKTLLNEQPKDIKDYEIAKIPIARQLWKRQKSNDAMIINEISALLSETSNDMRDKDILIPTVSPPISSSASPIATTPLPFSTTTTREPNPSAFEECILGRSNDNIKWVDENGKVQINFIASNPLMRNLSVGDYSRAFGRDLNFDSKDESNLQIIFASLEVLSLAYNNFHQLPSTLLNPARNSLLYLSLAGNKFGRLEAEKPSLRELPLLLQLDLRKCELKIIWDDLLDNLESLEYLYLSYNNIMTLHDSLKLPSLISLDLSYNEEQGLFSDEPNRLRISDRTFENLRKLQFLDLSHTKMEIKSFAALLQLPSSVIGISLCYTDLIFTGEKFLPKLNKIKFLDISGNTQINFTRTFFSSFSKSLERLDARDSNVRNLDWTKPLINLRVLNLKDNKIRTLDNSSFSHMFYLEDLNLERNSIGNWFTRLFSQNQELTMLNLRENTLTQLSAEMIEDILSVRYLAIGKNEFECSCSLNEPMRILFEVTKFADVNKLRDEAGGDVVDDQNIEATTLQSIFFGGQRTNFHPEYDVILRMYQKYNDQVLQSIEALRKNDFKGKSLISLSELTSPRKESFNAQMQTILLDYDENNEDYQCMNYSTKKRQLLLELLDLCDDVERKSAYMAMSDAIKVALSTSIPVVLIVSVLLFLTYWKWHSIRYFFVLCKNSAILTFLDNDDDGGKDVIVHRKSNSSVAVEAFLYDVFVSYSDQNRDWVLNEFLPNIEKRESINVCLHERDFQIGFGILENIVSCMDRSRCLLLVISRNFLQSQWCQFEMNLAQHRLLETRREKLIMVLLEDISSKKQPKILKYLMRTKTYIKWPEGGSEGEKQLFWKRLKKSIVDGKWEDENYGSIA